MLIIKLILGTGLVLCAIKVRSHPALRPVAVLLAVGIAGLLVFEALQPDEHPLASRYRLYEAAVAERLAAAACGDLEGHASGNVLLLMPRNAENPVAGRTFRAIEEAARKEVERCGFALLVGGPDLSVLEGEARLGLYEFDTRTMQRWIAEAGEPLAVVSFMGVPADLRQTGQALPPLYVMLYSPGIDPRSLVQAPAIRAAVREKPDYDPRRPAPEKSVSAEALFDLRYEIFTSGPDSGV